MKTKQKSWLIGLVLAGLGVALVRLVAPHPSDAVLRLVIYAAGIVTALAGLGFIMSGIKRG